MSYLLTNGSLLCRLGASASRQTAALVSALPAASSLSPGQVYTAKYYQTLSHKQKGQETKSLLSSLAVSGGCATGGNVGLAKRLMSSTGDHVTLWTAERILSAALVPVIPLALIMPCAPLDVLMAFGLAIHSHWGIEAIVVDYVRPSIFGPVIPKIAVMMVYGLSAMTLGGLFYFIYADVGLAQAIRMLWKL